MECVLGAPSQFMKDLTEEVMFVLTVWRVRFDTPKLVQR